MKYELIPSKLLLNSNENLHFVTVNYLLAKLLRILTIYQLVDWA